ncbi:hypothetical protein [Streptomyces clavuligerus]|uniref:Secreted protein n=1 Tax=Streptomyces clavuligerus TaxID=1901 RepID=B5GS21_STRCL|nr:hypothetical protein [Streptomyces clavuligerus]EDY49117.1 hypothetical protein SSCG_02145 [Streptomyces clavuligerus]EFG03814.1 Hypothetical protein SCLAV_p0323 [Streptomyces clavuligerus]MBY6307661.1 hypothetical protein [Streptomyces clavuligerus]QCS09790.1 hypothetical protein CRV15_29700 [Streptomyces clavuligerus]QPJ98168.1 hypothetical protein GE265_34710 [Streptomyces clavuligerus]
MRIRTVLLAAVLAAVTAAGLPITASTAHAVGDDLVCTQQQTADYNPPLRLGLPRPQHATVTGDVGTCADLSGSTPYVVSGSYTGSVDGNLSCLAGSGSGTLHFTWNLSDGTHDTSTVALDVVERGVIVAHVTSGRFTGDTVPDAYILDPSLHLLDCAGPTGLASLMQTGTLTFATV